MADDDDASKCTSCTHPHPVGALCPYSGCPSCGSTSHSNPSCCEDVRTEEPTTPATTESSAVKFDAAQFDEEFTRPASVDAALQLLEYEELMCMYFSYKSDPGLKAKIDEIVRTKDCIELARLAQWARKYSKRYELSLTEIAIALDWGPIGKFLYENFTGGIIYNAIQVYANARKQCTISNNRAIKDARSMGCYDFLRGLSQLGIVDPSEIPAWPPSADHQGNTVTSTETGGDEQNLLLETLRKTMTHVGELLMAGDRSGALGIVKRIPPATARKALAVIPPYRADIIFLLLREHGVVDAGVYARCLQMMESYNYHSRGVTIRLHPFVYPVVEAWSDTVTWNVEPDPFRSQYMTLFDTYTNISSESGDQRAIVSQAEFHMNLEAFLGYPAETLRLQELNMVMAGGCVVACLMPSQPESVLPPTTATLAERTAYYRSPAYESSDVDLFCVGPSKRHAFLPSLKKLVNNIQEALGGAEVLLLVRTRTVTIIPPYPHRRIQVHVGPWADIRDVLANTDVDCTGVGYDGNRVLFTLRSHFSWTHRCNIPDGALAYKIRGCPTYEKRLLKYAMRGFRIVDLGVPVSRICEVDAEVAKIEDARTELNGLKGLLWLRTVEKNPTLQTGGRRAGRTDIPFDPTMTHQKIVDRVTANGYCPSDNYGGHESGYLPCVWWCRNSVVIPKNADRTWNFTYLWHGVVNFYLNEVYADPETHRYKTPDWYSGIATMKSSTSKKQSPNPGDDDDDYNDDDDDYNQDDNDENGQEVARDGDCDGGEDTAWIHEEWIEPDHTTTEGWD